MNKRLIAIIASGAILSAGGAAAYFVTTRQDADSKITDTGDLSSVEASIVDAPPPEGIDTKPSEQEAPKLDEQLPPGTVSPHTVASDPNKYSSETLHIRGLITETNPGEYIITSQNPDEDQALRLVGDAEVINPHASSTFGDTIKFADPVTVEGNLVYAEKYQSIVLEMTSIK